MGCLSPCLSQLRLQSVMCGQCDARATITFSAAEHFHCPLAGTHFSSHWLCTKIVYQQMVTHLSTNLARGRVSLLIRQYHYHWAKVHINWHFTFHQCFDASGWMTRRTYSLLNVRTIFLIPAGSNHGNTKTESICVYLGLQIMCMAKSCSNLICE